MGRDIVSDWPVFAVKATSCFPVTATPLTRTTCSEAVTATGAAAFDALEAARANNVFRRAALRSTFDAAGIPAAGAAATGPERTAPASRAWVPARSTNTVVPTARTADTINNAVRDVLLAALKPRVLHPDDDARNGGVGDGDHRTIRIVVVHRAGFVAGRLEVVLVLVVDQRLEAPGVPDSGEDRQLARSSTRLGTGHERLVELDRHGDGPRDVGAAAGHEVHLVRNGRAHFEDVGRVGVGIDVVGDVVVSQRRLEDDPQRLEDVDGERGRRSVAAGGRGRA